MRLKKNLEAMPMIPDEILDRTYYRKYTKGCFLGKGGFAQCIQVTSVNSARVYAAKVISKANLTKKSAVTRLTNEIEIHRSLSHPHIVKLERFFEDEENVYILLELCSNRTLTEMLRTRVRLTEPEVRSICWQLLSALDFIHEHNVIHRDLKLANIMISKGKGNTHSLTLLKKIPPHHNRYECEARRLWTGDPAERQILPIQYLMRYPQLHCTRDAPARPRILL